MQMRVPLASTMILFSCRMALIQHHSDFPQMLRQLLVTQKFSPLFSPSGYTSLGPPRTFGNFRNNQDVFSFGQDLSWLHGNHSLKFGANERIYRPYNYRPDDPAGNYTFSRAFTARVPGETALQSGDATASFLLGNPATGRLGISPQIALQNKYYGFYIQDDWTVNRRLTLNLGLRWEAEAAEY